MTLLVLKSLAAYARYAALHNEPTNHKPLRNGSSHRVADSSEPLTSKDTGMSNQVDNWHKLARYDTNMQGELHANLLRNNGITVSLQPLSAIPGMNSGIVLWVQAEELAQAKRILSGVDSDTDGEDLLAQMSDAELGIVPDMQAGHHGSDNEGGKI